MRKTELELIEINVMNKIVKKDRIPYFVQKILCGESFSLLPLTLPTLLLHCSYAVLSRVDSSENAAKYSNISFLFIVRRAQYLMSKM